MNTEKVQIKERSQIQISNENSCADPACLLGLNVAGYSGHCPPGEILCEFGDVVKKFAAELK